MRRSRTVGRPELIDELHFLYGSTSANDLMNILTDLAQISDLAVDLSDVPDSDLMRARNRALNSERKAA